MNEVVVDASIAIAWIVKETRSSRATALLRDWARRGMRPVVPDWFYGEMSNALYQRVRDRRISLVDAHDNLLDLTRLVTTMSVNARVAAAALVMADSHRLGSTYDCLYLALAEQLDCELWTADERFWRATNLATPRVKWIGAVEEIKLETLQP